VEYRSANPANDLRMIREREKARTATQGSNDGTGASPNRGGKGNPENLGGGENGRRKSLARRRSDLLESNPEAKARTGTGHQTQKQSVSRGTKKGISLAQMLREENRGLTTDGGILRLAYWIWNPRLSKSGTSCKS